MKLNEVIVGDNALVLDCFAGSGTTLKIAKILKRNYIGIERSQEYADLIAKRLDLVLEALL